MMASPNIVWLKPEYAVEELYHTEGFAQAVARSHKFMHCMFALILANAVYIGIDLDQNDQPHLYDSHVVCIVLENFFACVFVIEIALRFMAFRCKKDCLRDAWFRFDSILVVFMVLETFVMAPLSKVLDSAALNISSWRLLRLLRLARMNRLIRSMPELVAMTRGLVAGIRACGALIFM